MSSDAGNRTRGFWVLPEQYVNGSQQLKARDVTNYTTSELLGIGDLEHRLKTDDNEHVNSVQFKTLRVTGPQSKL